MRISDWSSDVCSSDLAIDGKQVLIHTRDFIDIDGSVPGQRARFRLVGEAVASLTDGSGKRGLRQLRVDPARIATLYGAKREERRLVRLQDVPELLVTGLPAVEDRDFTFNRGVDPTGILRSEDVGSGTSVSVRVDLVGRRAIKKK